MCETCGGVGTVEWIEGAAIARRAPCPDCTWAVIWAILDENVAGDDGGVEVRGDWHETDDRNYPPGWRW